MLLGLIDTRGDGDEPEGSGRGRLLLDLPELRPWRWYVAAIVGLVLSMVLSNWLLLIPLIAGFGCLLRGVSSYYKGNDGLSKYRQ